MGKTGQLELGQKISEDAHAARYLNGPTLEDFDNWFCLGPTAKSSTPKPDERTE